RELTRCSDTSPYPAPQRCSTSASIIICAIRTTISRSTSGDAVASVSSNHSLSAGRMSLAATSRSPSFAFDSCEGSRSGRPHVTSIFPHGHQGDERVQTRTPPPWTLSAEAEAEHRAVLKAQRRVLGEEHQDTLNSRNNLASVLHHQEQQKEAEVSPTQSVEKEQKERPL